MFFQDFKQPLKKWAVQIPGGRFVLLIDQTSTVEKEEELQLRESQGAWRPGGQICFPGHVALSQGAPFRVLFTPVYPSLVEI